MPIYGKFLFKFDQEDLPDLKESIFHKEVRIISEIYKKCDKDTLCIFDDIGKFTDTIYGIALLSTIVENIKCKTLIVATNFEFENLTKINEKIKLYGASSINNMISIFKLEKSEYNLKDDLEGFSDMFKLELEHYRKIEDSN